MPTNKNPMLENTFQKFGMENNMRWSANWWNDMSCGIGAKKNMAIVANTVIVTRMIFSYFKATGV